MKKIAIFLPGPRREPVGGYKVLYQYGDYLASTGWSVDFIYLTSNTVCNNRFFGIKGRIKSQLLSCVRFYSWFPFLSSNIRHKVRGFLSKEECAKYDIFICSSVETFLFINKYTSIKCERIVYFVQDYEEWNIDKKTLHKTYSYKNVDYIAISDDLACKISAQGGKPSLILYNGINKKDFYSVIPWEERISSSFLFLYHPNQRKGCELLLQALCVVNDMNKDITFSCFSAYSKPTDFPSFINYYYQPSIKKLNELYNKNRFFICSSIYEGFGLTPAEAAFAGGIVVTTKNGGVEQYIEDGVNGFIIPNRTVDDFVSFIKEVVNLEGELSDFAQKSSDNITCKLDLDSNFNSLDLFLRNKYELLREKKC